MKAGYGGLAALKEASSKSNRSAQMKHTAADATALMSSATTAKPISISLEHGDRYRGDNGNGSSTANDTKKTAGANIDERQRKSGDGKSSGQTLGSILNMQAGITDFYLLPTYIFVVWVAKLMPRGPNPEFGYPTIPFRHISFISF